jgi:hypothetical protein
MRAAARAPAYDLRLRIASSRAFLTLSRSRGFGRPRTLMEWSMRLQRRCARMVLSTSRRPPSLLESGKCSCVGIQSFNSAVTGSK